MLSDAVRVRLILSQESEMSIRDRLPVRNYYMTSSYISAQKVRGAILSALREEICTQPRRISCETCAERDRCRFVTEVIDGISGVTPALPHCGCASPTELPAAPFTFFRCKICPDSEISDATSHLIHNTMDDAEFCKKHSPAEYAHFRKPYRGPVCLNCGKELPGPDKTMRPAISIDDVTGSAREGELYFTETLVYQDGGSDDRSGSEREDKHHLAIELTVSPNVTDLIKQIENNLFIQLGAGRGRGWGIVRVKKTAYEEKIERLVASRESALRESVKKNEGFVLIARTPLASIEVSEELGLVTRPVVEDVLGIPLTRSSGRTERVTGWSLYRNLQKPMLTAASPGSVFYYRVKEPDKLDYRALAEVEFTGVGQSIMRNAQMNQVVIWRG